MSLADKIWQAIQRPSPAVSYAEISALVDEWTAAPVATEEPDPNDSLRGSQWTDKLAAQEPHRLTIEMVREAARRAKEANQKLRDRYAPQG